MYSVNGWALELVCAIDCVCSVEQDQLGGAGYDPRPIEGLLLTGAKHVTPFSPGEFSFKNTGYPFEMRKLTGIIFNYSVRTAK